MIKRLLQTLLATSVAGESDTAEKQKIAFLNSVFLLAGIIAGVMSFIRIQHNLLLGLIEIGFTIGAFTLLAYLHKHHHKAEFISTLAICACYILFMSIYVLAPYNSTRILLFLLLAASALFLKGRAIGQRWVVLIITSIVLVELLPNSATGYSTLDIVTAILYIIAVFCIFNNYETLKEQQQEKLAKLNAQLEKEVEIRTQALYQANWALEQEKEALRTLSYKDQLTGLYNRFKLQELFEYEKNQSSRYGMQFSILLIDIDHFKQINDKLGHAAGDAVLKRVGKVLSDFTRKSDVAARWGGDEFVVFATETNLHQARELAEVIRRNIENADWANELDRNVTVSIGVASIADQQDLSNMMHIADKALYEAKRAGRNVVI